MKRRNWPLAYLPRLENRCLRWFMAYHGRGLSCCFLVVGALYGLYRGCGFTFFPPLSSPWEDVFWTLGKVAAALLLAALGHCVLLSMAACSADVRHVLIRITALLAEIPSFCFLGFCCAVLSPFWSVSGLAFFSLLTRSVHATLKAGNRIPSSFLKTARALRLGRWQSFWRLHVPFAFPELVRAVLRDLPGFWLQILGGELIISLFLSQSAPGLGGAFLSALKGGETGVRLIILFLMLGLILLVQHGLIGPLRGYGRHYAVCDLTQSGKDRRDDRIFSWRKHCVAGILGTVLTSILLSYGFWGNPDPLSLLVITVCMIGGFWGFAGGLLLGASDGVKKLGRQYCLIGGVVPLFLFCLASPFPIPTVFMPALAVAGLSGWTFFQYDSASSGRQFVMMGKYLRLPLLSSWKDVRFPLLCPALLQAGVVSLPFFWDNVYLAAFLEKGTLHLPMLRAHAYGMQAVLLFLMTLLAISVRWGIFLPLQERMAHRYRI